jgi:hypothetical protein
MSQMWTLVPDGDGSICQGDLFYSCSVPILKPDFETTEVIEFGTLDLLVMSHTCDLVNEKLQFVTLAPICSVPEFEQLNPDFGSKWKAVVQGRHEGVAVVGPCKDGLEDFRDCNVVDFHQIYSLPLEYLKHVVKQHPTPRYRLVSPYLEHVSQTFARFYMRVAIPDGALPTPPNPPKKIHTL